jgi:1-acyl-sn-glycerol-3-phosphate acyltransferase
MFDECRRTLQAGVSVMIFPEGTRSKNGELQPFKDGAFQLAIDAGAPLLPLAVSGTRDCMQKGSFLLHEARAVVRVLEPIDTQGCGPGDVERVKQLARERIKSALAERTS